MIVGCYTMHLYCANRYDKHGTDDTCKANKFRWEPAEFTGETSAQCKRVARSYGWRFRNGDATCPQCNKRTHATNTD